MSQQLPLEPSIPNYRFGTTLDGTAYIFNIRWNGREKAWYMDLFQEDETPIRSGMKLVLGTLLGGRSALATFPPGTLAMVDLSGADIDAGIDDMGVRVVLWYTPLSELLGTDADAGSGIDNVIIP